MNPRTKRTLTVTVVVVLVAALVWFLYPRSFAQAMGRSFDPENTCTVQAVLRKGGSSAIEVTLSPEDPAYGELMALLVVFRPQRIRATSRTPSLARP